MPDESFPEGRTAVAMAERVTRVETKLENLKEDTGVIRSSIHHINGELQKVVGLEQQRAISIKEIAKQTEHLPLIAQAMREFQELKPELVRMLNREKERRGRWVFFVGAGASLVGAATVIGVVITIVVLLIRGKLAL